MYSRSGSKLEGNSFSLALDEIQQLLELCRNFHNVLVLNGGESPANCAMMGLQATTTGVAAAGAVHQQQQQQLQHQQHHHHHLQQQQPQQQQTGGKRKLEAATTPSDASTPAKNGRWEAEDCIARLQAVAVPTADAWRAPMPALTQTLLLTGTNPEDDVFEEDDFEDEWSDDEKGPAEVVVPEPARFSQQPYNRYQSEYWQYYQPPQQQTIRCEENGKSYLELGASPPVRTRCCDGRTRWCHVPCYRQRRLAVLNLSMCKLARYRQCSDPSLRRSVLICNTLRRLEREMEAEPPEPSYPSSVPELTTPIRPSPVIEPSYEQSLRDMNCSGRATPFPSNPPDTDSGLGDDETTRPINWGSVLSLTSQTDLESMNNNELYAELGLNTEPTVRTEANEWDGFMHVLVGGT